VARNQPRNLRPRQLYKLRTQHHIMSQIVDADRKPFERNEGRGRSQIRWRRFLRRST
jgi:hypothetical protein